MRSLHSALLLLFLSSSCGVVLAQPDAGQTLHEQQQLLPPTMPFRSPDIGFTLPPMPVLPPIAAKGSVRVAEFRFIGDLVELGEDELPQLVRRYVGRTLTIDQLQQTADEVGRYLHEKGYSLARAYLGPQEIENGVVQITVLLGRVESDAYGNGITIRVESQGRPGRTHKERVRKIIADTTVAQSLYLKADGVERGLLSLNDMPGVEAQAQIDPGSEPGTTRLSVNVEEGPLWSGAVWADNFGNRYTGQGRLNAQLNLNNPSGSGDQAIVQASTADGLGFGRVGYSVPVGYEGTRLSASYTEMAYSLGEELSVLDADGYASVISVSLASPIIRTSRYSLFGRVAYDHTALLDERQNAISANKRTDAWNIVFDGHAADDFAGGGEIRYRTHFRLGTLDLSRLPASLANDRAGPDTDGAFNKAMYSLSRLQHLPGAWSVFARVEGQFADRNLDSSEQFFLGGMNGVRAYPIGEGQGDSGWLSSVELRYDLAGPPALGDWQFVVFYDLGSVELRKNTWSGWNADNPAQAATYRLRGSGIGVNLIKDGSHVVRAIYARKIGDNPGRNVAGLDSDGKQDDDRFWVQSLIYF